jgi:hypothetical protein
MGFVGAPLEEGSSKPSCELNNVGPELGHDPHAAPHRIRPITLERIQRHSNGTDDSVFARAGAHRRDDEHPPEIQTRPTPMTGLQLFASAFSLCSLSCEQRLRVGS